jgi:hypothetical protein
MRARSGEPPHGAAVKNEHQPECKTALVGVFFVKFMDYCFIICHASIEPKSAVVGLCQGLSV